MGFAWTIVALVAVMAISWRFLGAYMAAVFGGRVTWLRFAERPVYRMLGVDPDAEQSWQRYGVSLIIFSAVALGVTYAIFRLQGYLPFNPQHLPGVTRFAIMIPVLALAGSLAAKELVPASAGTFRTDAPMFVGLLTGVVLIVGALTFFPAVSLGPIVEQLSHGRFF